MVAASLYCSRDNDLMAKQETGLFLNLSVLETPVASFYRHRFLNQKMFFFSHLRASTRCKGVYLQKGK